MLTHSRLKEVLKYSKATGLFTWRITLGSRAKAGSVLSKPSANGYLTVRLDGKLYRSNRLAWFYVKGCWPVGEVDHIDTNKANNKWRNLRDVDFATNQQNRRKAWARSVTGVLGVFPRPNGKFIAQVYTEGRNNHLGTFTTAEEASAAYIKAKRRLHAGCTL